MTVGRVVVIGPGRVGLSLARALIRSGDPVAVLGRRARPLASPLEPVATDWVAGVVAADLVVIAVPDDALDAAARQLAATGVVSARQAVLHTSGLHDRSALAALAATGAALGSWHPLQTFAGADGDPDALAGSPAIVEGDARAVAVGRALAAQLGLEPVIELAAGAKARYHAGAVLASSGLVVLAETAARLAREAGAGDAARSLYLALMRRTLANVGAFGVAALTGPVSRGDAGTIARHLAVLDGPERELYVNVAREALRLAAARGLDGERRRAIEHLLY